MTPGLPALQSIYGVPDLQLDWFVLDGDGFRTKLDADGWLMFESKSAVNELKKEATLADTLI